MIIYPRLPRLIYDNLWRKGTIGTPSSEDPNHPATDTQIDTREMYFKASSKASPCTVPCDLGSARTVNSVAILSHNFEASGVTIKFEGADDDAFTTNPVTRTLVYNATDIFRYFSPMTKRHVRVNLEKGTNFTDYPQFAVVVCGEYSELNRRPIKGHTPGRDDITEIEESDSRVIFAQEKAILETDRYIFQALDDTTKDLILAFLKECGIHKAFVWCTDYTSANASSFWVRNSEIINPVFQYPNVWNWEIMMKEIK